MQFLTRRASSVPSSPNEVAVLKIQAVLKDSKPKSRSPSSSLSSPSASPSSRRLNPPGPFLVSESGLLMSGLYQNEDIGAKASGGVTHVINMAHDARKDAERKELHEAVGIKYLGVSALDLAGYDIMQHWQEVLEFAQDFYESREEGGEAKFLLIHCIAGINRSGALAVALVCAKDGKTLFDAIAQVRAGRAGPILTNVSFQHQLVDWARTHHHL